MKKIGIIITALLLGLSGVAMAQQDYWRREEQRRHDRELREQRQRHEQQMREMRQQFDRQQQQNREHWQRQREQQRRQEYQQRSSPRPHYPQSTKSSNYDYKITDNTVEKFLSDPNTLSRLKNDPKLRETLNELLTPQQQEMVRKRLSEANPATAADSAAKRKPLSGKLIIRQGTTTIKGYAYCNNQLDSVIIPHGVVTIENGAFSKNRLTHVVIPSSVTRIGSSAFQQNRLTHITIPEGVTEIGDHAFAYNQITSIVIPASVTKIGGNLFGLNNLPGMPTSITIGSNVEIDRFFGIGIQEIPSFSEFYNRNGKKAGTYVYANGVWSML
jgi:hypothetical protein